MKPDELDRLPIDPRTKEPLPPRAQPGYYPDYSVLKQQAFWDEATRKVVLGRIENVPPLRFFSGEDISLMEAVFARLLPQDDRDPEHRIPILPFVDERLFLERGDGYRFEDMPPDPEAYRVGMVGIGKLAQLCHGHPFHRLGVIQQDELLKLLHDGKADTGIQEWRRVPPHRFFMLMMHDVLDAYYSHPWAWDEIGYGGPAYPRGYMRLEHGDPEPWEAPERRYPWAPPPSARSGENQPIVGTTEHYGTPGQGGTH